jgi:hypothetical protein
MLFMRFSLFFLIALPLVFAVDSRGDSRQLDSFKSREFKRTYQEIEQIINEEFLPELHANNLKRFSISLLKPEETLFYFSPFLF